MYISRCIAKTIFLDLLKQLTIRVKGRAASWLARSGSVAPQQVLSSILIRSEFPAVGVKKPLTVLAAMLGPLGHGRWFGGFLYPGKPVWLPLNEKTVGPFPPRIEFFF